MHPGAQGHFDVELFTRLVQRDQGRQRRIIVPRVWVRVERVSFLDVKGADALGDQGLDGLTHQIVAVVPKELLGGVIDAGDAAVVVDQQDGVGGVFPDRLRQGGYDGLHAQRYVDDNVASKRHDVRALWHVRRATTVSEATMLS